MQFRLGVGPFGFFAKPLQGTASSASPVELFGLRSATWTTCCGPTTTRPTWPLWWIGRWQQSGSMGRWCWIAIRDGYLFGDEKANLWFYLFERLGYRGFESWLHGFWRVLWCFVLVGKVSDPEVPSKR